MSSVRTLRKLTHLQWPGSSIFASRTSETYTVGVRSTSRGQLPPLSLLCLRYIFVAADGRLLD